VDDWLRIEIPEGLDVIGPVARRVLTGVGLMYPPNAHIVMPMLDHAAGGTVVAGLGGDELFGLWERRRLADVAARRDRPRVADVGHLVEACVPPRARLAVARRPAESEALPWLRPAAQAELDRTLAEQHAYSTRRWDRHVRAAPRARSLTMALRHFRRIAATAEAEFRAPLLEPAFCESLARVGGWRGFGGRTATLRALFSGLLPDAVLARRQKAIFNDAFFTAETRRFATEWSGDGLDPAVVDPVALREAWTAPMLDYRSSLLLQSAWLHDRGGVRS
jgi:asparagine synthase (glutamine-hydrolysing)